MRVHRHDRAVFIAKGFFCRDLQVNVTANTAPTLTYAAAAVSGGGATTNSPTQVSDNGSITDYVVQSQLGYCLMTTGQTDAAIRYLQKGASLNSSYGPVWEHLGAAYQKLGRNRDAVSALETATRLLPSSRLTWQHLAQAYQATGRNADAQRAAAHSQQLNAASKASKKKT